MRGRQSERLNKRSSGFSVASSWQRFHPLVHHGTAVMWRLDNIWQSRRSSSRDACAGCSLSVIYSKSTTTHTFSLLVLPQAVAGDPLKSMISENVALLLKERRKKGQLKSDRLAGILFSFVLSPFLFFKNSSEDCDIHNNTLNNDPFISIFSCKRWVEPSKVTVVAVQKKAASWHKNPAAKQRMKDDTVNRWSSWSVSDSTISNNSFSSRSHSNSNKWGHMDHKKLDSTSNLSHVTSTLTDKTGLFRLKVHG